MRHNEIIDGVRIYDCNKEKVGYSRVSIYYFILRLYN